MVHFLAESSPMSQFSVPLCRLFWMILKELRPMMGTLERAHSGQRYQRQCWVVLPRLMLFRGGCRGDTKQSMRGWNFLQFWKIDSDMISLNMGMFFVQLLFLYSSRSEMETTFHYYWLQMWILINALILCKHKMAVNLYFNYFLFQHYKTLA